MEIASTEFGRQLMQVVGAQVGVTYVSAPLTTGLRDIRLMREKGVSKAELRSRYPQEYRRLVVGPNEREAHKYAQMVRRLGDRELVISPGELYVAGWTQPEYWRFWEEVIRSFCLEVVAAPGWELSTGARMEVGLALQTMLKVSDIRGRELGAKELQIMDARARAQLLREGFTPAEVEAYVPWIDFGELSADPAEFGESVRALSDIAVRHNQEARERRGHGEASTG